MGVLAVLGLRDLVLILPPYQLPAMALQIAGTNSTAIHLTSRLMEIR